ncbi:MAG: AraC family transcriptional regulator [Rhodobacteraceae bacterium]|jgi:AraC family transcriptional activator of pobA|nr:AraC family transcriptional regulator [Paracoccaceae bacterium]
MFVHGLSSRLGQPQGYAVTSLGKHRMREAWRVENLHSDRQHRLFWITRGQGRVFLRGVTRGYGPNNAIYAPSGVQLALELPPQTQGLVLRLPEAAELGLPREPFHLRITAIEAQGILTSHLEKVDREISAAAPAMDRALNGYGLLISAWMTRELSRREDHDAHHGGDAGHHASHHLAARFSDLMETQFRSGQGIAQYAAALQVTPTHLSRVCKEATGRPAHALLTERVMYEAMRLLTDTDMPAREIAETLGFSSPAYFTRAFTQATGHPPSAFRKLA